MEEFSKRLIMLRKENDLSQFGLGLELGVSRSTIAGYEAIVDNQTLVCLLILLTILM